MKISERQHAGVAIVDIQGRPQSSGPQIVRFVETLLARGERRILLSLHMEAFDSGCLGEVVVSYLRSTNKSALMKVAALDRRSWAVVGSSHIKNLVECFSSEEEALASFEDRG